MHVPKADSKNKTRTLLPKKEYDGVVGPYTQYPQVEAIMNKATEKRLLRAKQEKEAEKLADK